MNIQNAFTQFQNNQFQESLNSCRQLIESQTNLADAYYLAGLCQQRLEKRPEALLDLKKARELAPQNWNCLCDLAHCLRELGDFVLAKDAYQKVLQNDSQHYLAYYGLGLNFLAQNNALAAQDAFEKSLQIKGNFLMAINGLASALKALQDYDSSEKVLNQILEQLPNDISARGNLANLYFETGRFEEAFSIIETLLQDSPHDARLNFNMANILVGLGQYEKAIEIYRKSLSLDPDSVEAHYNYACLLLQLEYYEEGFKEYAWRKKVGGFQKNIQTQGAVPWQGEDLSGKTLLIRSEQGIGDCLQFSRLLDLIPQELGRLDFLLPARFHALFEGRPPSLNLVKSINKSVNYDYEVHLIDLAEIYSIRESYIPAPLSFAKPELFNKSRFNAIKKDSRRKIGLCWRGGKTHFQSMQRSLLLKDLQPLLELDDIQFVSLQQDLTVEEKDFPLTWIEDLDTGEHAFADTLEVLDSLDRVISIDSSLAHLAASQGKHVDLLLPTWSEWRWLHDREDSPWYPSMKLWRLEKGEGWKDLVLRLKEDLL